jgi:hypothetical protein
MKKFLPVVWLAAGVAVGIVGSQFYLGPARTVEAGDTRYEDFIMCTGRVQSPQQRNPIDGLWILDYRSGKLLGTVIDRNVGKIIGWAEVDLVNEFGIQPKQNVHFMMTTGAIAEGQDALYLTETSTGKLGIYTLGPRPDTPRGIAIRRHDMVFFRNPQQQGN